MNVLSSECEVDCPSTRLSLGVGFGVSCRVSVVVGCQGDGGVYDARPVESNV